MKIFNNTNNKEVGSPQLSMVYNGYDDTAFMSIFSKKRAGLWEGKGTGHLAVENRPK